ncbi:hypothetical protein BJY04DRAFT_223136 [Aspergillus karnatakaensis]|uniref:Zn(II)2Cys6 transcription factor n=1 Tax=Aspergillus karnatakaensis TaxID=1810916 RepID=UPI003CCC95D1
MSDANIQHTGGVVYRATNRRTFKACRTCRLQKARCIINTPNPPCRRCRATGRDCIFEEITGGNTSRRRTASAQATEKNDEATDTTRLARLEQEVARLRETVGQLSRKSPRNKLSRHTSDTDSSPWLSPSPSSKGLEAHRAPQPARLGDRASAPEDLGHMHLDAPITAVHAMTSRSFIGDRVSPTEFPLTEQKEIVSASKGWGDLISREIISEHDARRLFQLYMANANVFLPLFDPAADDFDSMRAYSPFCFVTILAIALRVDPQTPESITKGGRCLQEARHLAMKSLFASSVSVETVQGMLLLAAYSESNWFAVSHAYQMGLDLGLLNSPEREDMPYRECPEQSDNPRSYEEMHLSRMLRTGLILHQVEQEIGSGTAHRSQRAVPPNILQDSSLSNLISAPQWMRIVSNIEIVHIRERMLHDIGDNNIPAQNIPELIGRVDGDIEAWFIGWDAKYEALGCPVTSFSRSSLRLQRDYAFIIISSAIISKLGSRRRSLDSIQTMIDATLERSTRILASIAEKNDYKWYLPWAPTYSALFPAFTATLAMRLARLRPDTVDWGALNALFAAVAGILERYPYPQFARIIRELASLAIQLASSRDWNPPRPTNDSTIQLAEQFPFKSAPIRHATPEAVNSAAIAGPDSTSWIASSESHSGTIENGTDANDPYAAMDLAIPSLPSTPGYMLDFNSFAASLQMSFGDVEDYTLFQG